MADEKRVITVVLEIDNAEEAKAIWDSHLACKNLNGCRVAAIAEGDLVKKVEELDDRVWALEEKT